MEVNEEQTQQALFSLTIECCLFFSAFLCSTPLKLALGRFSKLGSPQRKFSFLANNVEYLSPSRPRLTDLFLSLPRGLSVARYLDNHKPRPTVMVT